MSPDFPFPPPPPPRHWSPRATWVALLAVLLLVLVVVALTSFG